MDGLYLWELQSGYITREKLEENEQLCFLDSKLEIEFRVQVNLARSKYIPKQLEGGPAGSGGRKQNDGRKQTGGTSTETERDHHCAICRDNVGSPGKETLRVFEFTLPGGGRDYFLQLTPFPVFPYHFVVITVKPEPMSIDYRAMREMMLFQEAVPGYTVCSNSDVDWAGSSILDHHHLQVFKGLILPVMTAGAEMNASAAGCTVQLLVYPAAAVRVFGGSREEVLDAAWNIVRRWKERDPGKNTVNLIFHETGGLFVYHIFFRNPAFLTPEKLRRIKSEGIGVIEAAGVGIFPVPAGDDAEELRRRIRGQGGEIMKGILGGINPLPDGERKTFFDWAVGAARGA
jgi:galactose-1-phosphate uridylyltransferase